MLLHRKLRHPKGMGLPPVMVGAAISPLPAGSAHMPLYPQMPPWLRGGHVATGLHTNESAAWILQVQSAWSEATLAGRCSILSSATVAQKTYDVDCGLDEKWSINNSIVAVVLSVLLQCKLKHLNQRPVASVTFWHCYITGCLLLYWDTRCSLVLPMTYLTNYVYCMWLTSNLVIIHPGLSKTSGNISRNQ